MEEEKLVDPTNVAIAITVLLGIIVWLTDNPLRSHHE